jgi:carboxylate-amine ligase
MQMRLDETIAIGALCQAIMAKLYKLHSSNLSFRGYSRALIMENKWRAARYGLDGKLIDFGKQSEVDERELIGELLDFVSDVVGELGSGPQVAYVHQILARGTGADRQLRVFNETNDLKQVVDYMIQETALGIFPAATPLKI